jgi:hypothetical protein
VPEELSYEERMHPENAPEDAYLDPLSVFVTAMQAARELEDFIAENAGQISDVEAAFTSEATRRYPSVPIEQHQAAAALVHRKIHERMEALDRVAEQGGGKRDLDAARDAVLDGLRNEMLELTGQPEDYWRYSTVWSRVASRKDPTRVLRGSLLISVVSDFEVLVSNLVRAQLSAKPEILRSDERKYTFRELDAFASLEDFRAFCADKMAEGLLRGGLEDWLDWFGARHKVDVPGVTDCPEEFQEIFQRRHLLVHNGGLVNGIYLAKMAGRQDLPKAGELLYVTRSYLLDALDVLTSAGIKLAVAVARKMTNETSAFDRIDHKLTHHLMYDLLISGQNRVVQEVNGWHLTFVGNASSQFVIRVNRWVAMKRRLGTESIREEVESWDTQALAQRFRLVRLALLDRHEEAHALVKRLLDTDEIDNDDWQTWPVLEGTREYAAAQGDQPPAQKAWLLEAPHAHAAIEDPA